MMNTDKERIEYLERRLANCLDDPDFDGTDFAHPAWWRGHDDAVGGLCRMVNEILDGKDDGSGWNVEPLATVRKRLLALCTSTNSGESQNG